MSTFLKTMLVAVAYFISVFANGMATEAICNNCKTAEDFLLWAGHGCPNQFNPRLVRDNVSKKAALEKGLKLCEEHAEKGICENQELLGIYYFSEKNEFKKGLFWLTKCAAQGSSRGSIFCLMLIYMGLGLYTTRMNFLSGYI